MATPAGTGPDPAPPPRRPSRLTWLLPLALGVLAASAALRNGFTNDDDILIVNNPRLRGPGALWEAVTTDYFHGAQAGSIGYWRPLTKLSFALEYRAFGSAPKGYHLVSLAWFAAAVAAGFALARALALSPWGACAALAFFAAHPAHAEATAIATARSDLVATAGILAALLGYVRWRRSGRRRWLALLLAAEVVALGSKETAVLIPVLAGLWEWLERGERPLRVPRLPAWQATVAPVALYALARVALGVLPSATGGAGDPAAAAVAGAKLVTCGLVRTLAPPLWVPDLDQDRPAADGAALARYGLSALVALTLALAAARRWPRARTGLAWIALPLALLAASQSAVHVSSDPRALVFADRWLALPVFGAGLLGGVLLEGLAARSRAATAVATALWIAWCVLLARTSAAENASYRSELARADFVAAALREKAEPSARDRERLLRHDAARALVELRYAESAEGFAELVRLHPADTLLRYSLAQALAAAGDLDAAHREAHLAYHGVLPDGTGALPPDDTAKRYRTEKAYLLGTLCERRGERGRARQYYEAVLALDPTHADARKHLAVLSPGRPSGGGPD